VVRDEGNEVAVRATKCVIAAGNRPCEHVLLELGVLGQAAVVLGEFVVV